MQIKKRLIDAYKLEDLVRSNCARYHHVDDVMAAIAGQPTVDAVEVVHGHWCWEGQFKACSQCGSYVEWNETLGASFWKFCPYCGAKMDGVKECLD